MSEGQRETKGILSLSSRKRMAKRRAAAGHGIRLI